MGADEGRTEDQNTFRADRGSSPGLLRRYFYVSDRCGRLQSGTGSADHTIIERTQESFCDMGCIFHVLSI